jgi:Na+-driven multidrug efflux pump
MLFLTPLWPAYGEALQRGDFRWIRRNMAASLWITCTGIIALGILLLWKGEVLLRLWVGTPVSLHPNLVIGMCAGFVLRGWVDCRSVVFNAAGHLRTPMYFWAAQALLNLLLSVVLVRAAGVAGLVWAGPISAALTTFWGYPWMMRRFLASRQPSEQSRVSAPLCKSGIQAPQL